MEQLVPALGPTARRSAAVLLPAVLVLSAAGPALAAKPAKISLTAYPGKVTSSTSATFAWSGTSAGYTCALDGAKAAACTSPVSYSGLRDASHTFVVKSGTGKAGGANYGWRVDTVPPAAPAVTPVASPTSATTATVSFSDSDASVVGYTCALDAAAAVACTSPVTYSGLSEAAHTVVVRARDAAGNVASGSTTWTVDHTAPDIPDVVPPASPTRLTSVQVGFSGATGVTFTCALDGAAATACTSPWTSPALAEGPHALAVYPVDAAGNVGKPGVAGWVVDLTPPAVPTLVTSPASPTNQTDAEVRFADLDLTTASYTCSLDGAPAAACTSPWTNAAPLSPVSHTLEVRALDLAGNASAALPVTWAVDTSAPAPPVFLSGPATPTADQAPAFDFTGTDTTTASFTCSLDGAAFAACQPGDAFPVSTQGSHSLAVKALDSAGNASSPAVWGWVLDLTPPAAPKSSSTTSTDTGPSRTAPVLVFSSDDPSVAGFVCLVDGAAPVPCASGFQPSVGDGSHTVVVKTVDAAGNVSSTGITFTFTVDTTAPTMTTAVPATLVAPAVLTFSEDVVGVTAAAARLVSGTTPVATALSCRSAAGAVVSCAGPVRKAVLTPSPRLVPGQRYATALAAGIKDLAGNAAVLRTASFRGQLVQQESSPAAVSSWRSVPSSAAYGGRYSTSDVGGSTATYAFRGTAITWFTATGPAMGTAKVYVDGTYKGTVNNYAGAAHWRVARSVSGLTNAVHTLRVVPTGLRGSVYGRGTGVVVDAVKVGATLTTNPAVRTAWDVATSSKASGSRFAVADDAGATFAMAFRGTRLTWFTAVGKNMGLAKVYIDGVYRGTFDGYAATAAFNVQRSWSLTDAVHTVRVVVQGKHRTGATGSRVVVDAFTVR